MEDFPRGWWHWIDCSMKNGLKHSTTVTLWLCQNSYCKWPLIVDFSIKNGGSFHCYVSLPEGNISTIYQINIDTQSFFMFFSWWELIDDGCCVVMEVILHSYFKGWLHIRRIYNIGYLWTHHWHIGLLGYLQNQWIARFFVGWTTLFSSYFFLTWSVFRVIIYRRHDDVGDGEGATALGWDLTLQRREWWAERYPYHKKWGTSWRH